eukprot:scaffold69921_cov61-Phaeocystis_antarctica.AAC.3
MRVAGCRPAACCHPPCCHPPCRHSRALARATPCRQSSPPERRRPARPAAVRGRGWRRCGWRGRGWRGRGWRGHGSGLGQRRQICMRAGAGRVWPVQRGEAAQAAQGGGQRIAALGGRCGTSSGAGGRGAVSRQARGRGQGVGMRRRGGTHAGRRRAGLCNPAAAPVIPLLALRRSAARLWYPLGRGRRRLRPCLWLTPGVARLKLREAPHQTLDPQQRLVAQLPRDPGQPPPARGASRRRRTRHTRAAVLIPHRLESARVAEGPVAPPVGRRGDAALGALAPPWHSCRASHPHRLLSS